MKNYEEKYKKALERARNWRDKSGMPDYKKGILDDIFPELAESEDEKIRKALLEMVHDTTGDSLWVDYNIHKEDAIAWLEKQGETFTKKDVDDAYLKGISDAKNELEKQGEQKPKFRIGDTIKCKYDDRQFTIKSVDLDKGTYTYTQENCGNDIDYADEEFELVEQKPAWSEEDDKFINLICDLIAAHSTNGYIGGYYAADLVSRLKSLKDRVQLKQEWSEEEKARIDRIIEILDWAEEKGRISYSDWEDYVGYVRTLHPQSKHSWYKMDDKTQKEIINYFEALKEHEPTRNNTHDKWIDWLKSLRPQKHEECSIDKAIEWLNDTFLFYDNSSGRREDYEIVTYDFDSMEDMFKSFKEAVSQKHWNV